MRIYPDLGPILGQISEQVLEQILSQLMADRYWNIKQEVAREYMASGKPLPRSISCIAEQA